MSTLETPRSADRAAEKPATRSAHPGSRFIKALVAEPHLVAKVEKAPDLDKAIFQESILRKCRNQDRIQAGEEHTPEGIAHREAIRQAIDAFVIEAGFTIEEPSRIKLWGERLPEFGWTYNVFIGQSNIDIHTYSQAGTVAVGIAVCSSEMQKMESHDGKDSILHLFDNLQSLFGADVFYDPSNPEHAGRENELSFIGERREYVLASQKSPER